MKTKADFRAMTPDAICAAMNETERRVFGRLAEPSRTAAPRRRSEQEYDLIAKHEGQAVADRLRAEEARRQ